MSSEPGDIHRRGPDGRSDDARPAERRPGAEGTAEFDFSHDPMIKLTRWFFDTEPVARERPPWSAVRNYLLGTATSRERAAVHSAMLRSRPFRQEMAEMVRDLRELESAGPVPTAEAAGRVQAPSWEEFRAQRMAAEREKAGRREQDRLASRESSRSDRDRRNIRTDAAELVQFLVHSLSPLAPRLFSPVVLRGEAGPVNDSPPHGLEEYSTTSEEAAMLHLMRGVRRLDGEYVPVGDPSPAPPRSRPVSLRFARGGKWRPEIATFHLPVAARELEVWLLAFPELALFHARVSRSKVFGSSRPEGATSVIGFESPVGGSQQFRLAITYQVDGRHMAVTPHVQLGKQDA